MAKNRWLDVQIRQNIEARHEQLVAVHTRSPKQAIVSEAAREKIPSCCPNQQCQNI